MHDLYNSTIALLITGALACGGGGQATKADPSVTQAGHPQDSSATTDGREVPPLAGEDTGTAGDQAPVEDGAPSEPPVGDTTEQGGVLELAPVTFTLVNTAAEELVFSVDKGWQPNIFAYTGTPPKATPIIMFPKHCTVSCDLDAEAICPVCDAPTSAKEERENEQREVVAPGAKLSVPWDGKVFVYDKARGKTDGKKTKCECWRKEDPPAADYTVKACGFRVTKEAGKRSQYQCVEGTMTLPPADGAMEVRLEFPGPAKGKRKGRHR